MAINDVVMDAGRNRTLTVTVTDSVSGAPINLTGCTLKFTVKPDLRALDTAALFQLATGTGITHTSPAQGIAEIAIVPANTSALLTAPNVPALYQYDITLKDATNKVYTIKTGRFTVRLPVTRTI